MENMFRSRNGKLSQSLWYRQVVSSIPHRYQGYNAWPVQKFYIDARALGLRN